MKRFTLSGKPFRLPAALIVLLALILGLGANTPSAQAQAPTTDAFVDSGQVIGDLEDSAVSLGDSTVTAISTPYWLTAGTTPVPTRSGSMMATASSPTAASG